MAHRLLLALVASASLSGCGSAAGPGSSSTAASPTPSLASPASSAPASASPSRDPTEGWLSHSSLSGELAFRYDSSWKLAECDPNGRYPWGTTAPTISTTVFLGSASQSPTQCPPENESPEILITSTLATQTPNATPGPSACGGRPGAVQTVSVDGVAGTRLEVTYPTGYRECIGVAVIRRVDYTFNTAGRTYAVGYAYRQGDASDLTGEFDVLVQQTFRFSAS